MTETIHFKKIGSTDAMKCVEGRCVHSVEMGDNAWKFLPEYFFLHTFMMCVASQVTCQTFYFDLLE